MSDLPEFTKSFSCVDLLAYFVPGSMFTLFSNWLLPDNIKKIFSEPINAMFPGNTFALAVYFCIVSYLIGMLLSELSYWLWRICGFLLGFFRNLLGKFFTNILDKSLSNKLGKFFGNMLDKFFKKTGNNRLAVIPHTELIRKEQLFQSFFQLCRCCAVVLPLLWLESVYAKKWTLFDLWWFFSPVEAVLLIRAWRFNSYRKEYQDELKRREIKPCPHCLVQE